MPRWPRRDSSRPDPSRSDPPPSDASSSDSRGPAAWDLPLPSPHSIYSRRETKYELDIDAAESLRSVVASHLPCYEFRVGHPYTYITTIYFDTDRLEFFERAARSYNDNMKIRVKEYYYRDRDGDRESDGAAADCVTFPYCFVEIKQREGGLVMKRRMRLPKSLLNALIHGEDVWRDLVRLDPGAEFDEVRDVYAELKGYLESYAIRPRSIIHYRRCVYQKNEDQLRITFDDRLKIYRPPEGLYDAVPSLVEGDLLEPTRSIGKVILETKCRNRYPQWLREALTNLSPRRISKFTTSMNLLHRGGSGPGDDSSFLEASGPGDPGDRREMEDSREQSVLR